MTNVAQIIQFTGNESLSGFMASFFAALVSFFRATLRRLTVSRIIID